jgi:3-oxoacyl-(acyl-carrier-protein) synthase
MKGPGVAITATGVVSACGLGIQEHWESFQTGIPPVSELTHVKTGSFPCKTGFTVRLDLTKYLNRKILRYQDRITHFGILALENCLKDYGPVNKDEVGLIIGSLLGGVCSQSKLNNELLQYGPQYITPFSFPNTLINSPTFETGMTHELRNLYYCLATGCSAGADALGFGFYYLKSHPDEILVAGSMEDINLYNYLGFTQHHMMLPTNDAALFCPLDRRRDGCLLGEGAALFAMESCEHAGARGAPILAEMAGYSSLSNLGSHKEEYLFAGMKDAMSLALRSAELVSADIDLVLASANGSPSSDLVEAKAISEVFGSHSKENLWVTAPKSLYGECMSLSAPLAVLTAILALNKNFLAPTLNYREADPQFRLNIVTKPLQQVVRTVMINSFSCYGHQSVIILQKGRRG